MIETTESDIDVDKLMTEIREAVAEREATGRKSLVDAALELGDILSRIEATPAKPSELPPLELEAEFVPAKDDQYHINDLLRYHDQAFIWNAYRAILKREPDEVGLTGFLKNLRSGRSSKMDVLASLRFSPEGAGKNVHVEGLTRRPLVRRLYRVPVFGYVLEVLDAIWHLPDMIHSQRQSEGFALRQLDHVASHVNQLSNTTFQLADSVSQEVAELTVGQRRFAELQHQETVGLFRKQREIIRRLEELKAEFDAVLPTLQDQAGFRRIGGRASIDEMRRDMDKFFASFADEFRGLREEIKGGLAFYLQFLKAAGIKNSILDIGCGRGEWLELLKEQGLEARGVDTNQVMIEQLRSQGLEVTEEDALAYLHNLPDGTLNAVTGFHFIEHLSFETLIELVDEIDRVLQPNGLVIFETPNPKNLVVAACNFYSDPTHVRPLFPDTVGFILNSRGFADVRVEYLNPVSGSPFTDESESSRVLNSWLYSPRDFAVIGRKVRSQA